VLEAITRLILQPNIAHEEVRKWLVLNHYHIVDEELVEEDDKLYNIIVAEHGREETSDQIDYYIGRKLVEKKDPLLNKLLKHRIDEMNKIISQIEDKKTDNVLKRLDECKTRLNDYQELLKFI
jgi:tRNA (adenine22-N1)-methyltransferase